MEKLSNILVLVHTKIPLPSIVGALAVIGNGLDTGWLEIASLMAPPLATGTVVYEECSEGW